MQEDVDVILAVFLSWAEDVTWIHFLRNAPDLPLIFYSPVKERYPYVTTEDDDDFIEFLAAGGLVGALVGSGSIQRFQRDAKVIVGDHAELTERLRPFVMAAKAKKILQKSQFGLLANYNELMWATYVDPYRLFSTLGPELRFLPYSDLQKATDSVTDSRAASYVDELRSRYRVDDSIDEAKFLESARASLGLANIVNERDIDALALNDVDRHLFEMLGLRPGFFHPSIYENKSCVVPEGDLGGALITYILTLLSHDHVNFIEPFYIEGHSGTFAGGHAGPNDHTDPRYQEYVRVSIDVRFAKTSYKYAGSPFAWYRIPPGSKTIAHLSESHGKFKIVCFLAESLDGEHCLSGYSHSLFRPHIPVNELFERVIATGTTQHFATVDGDFTKHLRELAALYSFDFQYIR